MRMSTELGRTVAVAALAVAFATIPSATAQAGTITYTAVLSGAIEAPPNASPGTGFATVVYDDIAHTLLVSATFQDLIGTTTAAHIHAATTAAGTGTAGVATTVPTFVGFPLGVTSGVYLNTLDLTLASSWNPSFVTAHGGTPGGAEAYFAQSLADGKAYFNIHTNAFTGGEIRGFLTVPEPGSSLVLLGIGIAGLFARRQRRR